MGNGKRVSHGSTPNEDLWSFPLVHAILAVAASRVCAVGGTAIIATKGQPAPVSAGWPQGTAAIVNDPGRTTGWNDWFSEWPNDVNQYAFEIKNVADVNRLIEKLAAIKSDLREVRLSYLSEPSGLGWVTHLPKGNGFPVIFSVGDQGRINDWYKTVASRSASLNSRPLRSPSRRR